MIQSHSSQMSPAQRRKVKRRTFNWPHNQTWKAFSSSRTHIFCFHHRLDVSGDGLESIRDSRKKKKQRIKIKRDGEGEERHQAKITGHSARVYCSRDFFSIPKFRAPSFVCFILIVVGRCVFAFNETTQDSWGLSMHQRRTVREKPLNSSEGNNNEKSKWRNFSASLIIAFSPACLSSRFSFVNFYTQYFFLLALSLLLSLLYFS